MWLNDVFLNTSYGKLVIALDRYECDDIDPVNSSTDNTHIIEETDDTFYFPEGSIHAGQDNVITIVQVCCFIPIDSTSTDFLCPGQHGP